MLRIKLFCISFTNVYKSFPVLSVIGFRQNLRLCSYCTSTPDDIDPDFTDFKLPANFRPDRGCDFVNSQLMFSKNYKEKRELLEAFAPVYIVFLTDALVIKDVNLTAGVLIDYSSMLFSGSLSLRKEIARHLVFLIQTDELLRDILQSYPNIEQSNILTFI